VHEVVVCVRCNFWIREGEEERHGQCHGSSRGAGRSEGGLRKCDMRAALNGGC
jgi:hypothetical protein